MYFYPTMKVFQLFVSFVDVKPKDQISMDLFRSTRSLTNLKEDHNHPSGNSDVSQADIKLTEKLGKAGEFLDIQLLDHVILTCEGFYSMSDEGICFM